MGLIDEIKAGGVKGCLGLDQIDWGGNEVYAVWKLAPCCGGPDLMGALKCIGMWSCCGWCAMSKLYSQSMGQTWNIIPACVFVACCPSCAGVFTRYNLRKSPGNILGDCVCCHCCGPCAACQTLRAASINQWFLLPPDITIVAPQIKLIK